MVFREPLKVHCDIHTTLPAELGYGTIRQEPDIDKSIHGCRHPFSHFVFCVRTKGEAQDFKLASIVPLKQFGQ
jgi:hypothetical protein